MTSDNENVFIAPPKRKRELPERSCGCQPYGKHRKECIAAKLKRCTCPDGFWDRRNRIPTQRHVQACPLWPSMVAPTWEGDQQMTSDAQGSELQRLRDRATELGHHDILRAFALAEDIVDALEKWKDRDRESRVMLLAGFIAVDAISEASTP
jgi:hypothetical protein